MTRYEYLLQSQWFGIWFLSFVAEHKVYRKRDVFRDIKTDQCYEMEYSVSVPVLPLHKNEFFYYEFLQ